MYSKCQLVHLDKIKPESVEESHVLLQTLEVAVKFYLHKLIVDRAYRINNAYCNRKSIDYQSDSVVEVNKYLDTPEMVNLTSFILQFVSDVLDVFYIYQKTNHSSQLNIELSLLSRHNLAISYEIF